MNAEPEKSMVKASYVPIARSNTGSLAGASLPPFETCAARLDGAERATPHIGLVVQGLGAGGTENIAALICNHLVDMGWEVTLFAFTAENAPPYYQHSSKVRIVRLGLEASREHPWVALRLTFARVKRLRAALAEKRPDALLSFLTRTNVVSVLAAGKLGITTIVSERNNAARQPTPLSWRLLRELTYPRAYGLITMTQRAMDHFPARLRRRHWVIPNPAVAPKVELTSRNGARNLVAVGRLVHQKGFDLLIEAFAQTKSAKRGWRLLIYGEGPERAALEQQISRLNLNGRVILPGTTTKPGEWIAQADVFVLSSRYEGWGIVLGEAMAAGIPVISFDCPYGPSEMIKHRHNGLLVEAEDIAAMTTAIDEICIDPVLRSTLGSNALSSVVRLAPEAILRAWTEVINEAASVR